MSWDSALAVAVAIAIRNEDEASSFVFRVLISSCIRIRGLRSLEKGGATGLETSKAVTATTRQQSQEKDSEKGSEAAE
ncbi:uncharacterized protein K452DRAFT_321475 [Aplosporella prunicola CBS 121167]|uniref:Uncharacterized protein n=1 Tax=Aplosporella prunicola CBS 121167 TaxID=1176127 RepID=A0A6A6B4D4_9PEZI|nr:uncharacterized protein K452DRAFT_321475 [Aplosporella prunicola CBS 121167]KAF2138125.1 hypothetical protein K452DRAFT_321475 [Aplosporella prunicola CBS 121167]